MWYKPLRTYYGILTGIFSWNSYREDFPWWVLRYWIIFGGRFLTGGSKIVNPTHHSISSKKVHPFQNNTFTAEHHGLNFVSIRFCVNLQLIVQLNKNFLKIINKIVILIAKKVKFGVSGSKGMLWQQYKYPIINRRPMDPVSWTIQPGTSCRTD